MTFFSNFGVQPKTVKAKFCPDALPSAFKFDYDNYEPPSIGFLAYQIREHEKQSSR